MATSNRRPASSFVALMRKIYNPIGFKKGYNALLWFIGSGYLMGFTLARLMYLDFNGIYCNRKSSGGNGAAPGECYNYTRGHYKIGMMLHLFTILPAAFLVCFQFVPFIRYKAILFHRVNGYVVITLSLVGIAGALMIARVAFGGGLETQVIVGLLSILTFAGFIMAYYNIKRLQIDQHRAWMLRTWAWMASIITTRLIMVSCATIISVTGDYYATRPCAQIAWIYGGGPQPTLQYYPECAAYFNGTSPNQHAVVRMLFKSGTSRPEQIGAALGNSFGMALWLAFILHAIGIEIYLRLTPRESERLRKVSYERQLEAGFKHPGSAGLTADRFGDSDLWQPDVQQRKEVI